MKTEASNLRSRTRRLGWRLMGLFFVTMICFAACEPRPMQDVSPTPTPAAAPLLPLVRGYLVASVGGAQDPGAHTVPIEQIYLPKVRVILRDLALNTDSAPVVTDLSGRFTARVGGPGRYQVCWDAEGFTPGCTREVFEIDREFHNIGVVTIALSTGSGNVAVYGQVTLADGTSGRTLDPLANINAFATISLLDSGGVPIYEIPVNNDDKYLFPSVPWGKPLQLRIYEEGYDQTQPLQIDTPGVLAKRIDFQMANSPPQLEPLVALSKGQRVSNAEPGMTVTLRTRVSDRDQDRLSFLWKVSAGTLSSPTDPEPEWTLPDAQGNHAATLIVYDGRGGYDRSTLTLTIDPAGLTFSGTVSGTDTLALEGAEVDVNGVTTVTDSRGYFLLRVPDQRRFVMTIRKTGYAFVSNIYYDSLIGGRWRLTRAQTFSVDPTRPIDLQNRRIPSDCPGSSSDRLDWQGHPALAVPQYQDGRGNPAPLPKDAVDLPGLPTTDPPGELPCGPGIRVQIPANSLVDANGRPPNGRINIQLSTVDLRTPDQMPGNYTLLLSNGDATSMQSYGAGTVEIFSGTTEYDLRPGTQATLTIPVDAAQVQAGGPLTPTIPLLTYDEERGVWVEDGKAKLQTVSGRPVYVGQVTHFTAYNTDHIKVNQSCLAIQNNNMPPSYDLEVTMQDPGNAAYVKFLYSLEGSNRETALLNLPSQQNIVLVPIRINDPDPAKNNLPMGVFVVNTGAPQNPSWPLVPGGWDNEPVGPPYYEETNGVPSGACSTKVILSDLGLQFYPQTPPQGEFLYGLNFAAVNLSELDPANPSDVTLKQAVEQASQDYRDQIDPRDLRPSLTCFKVVNRMPLFTGESCPQHTGSGFVQPAPFPTDTVAVYANTVDLGFGREMHCVKDERGTPTDETDDHSACYVSNYDSLEYTGPGQGTDVTKALSAANGLANPFHQDATVAMEFSPIEDEAPDGDPVTYSDPERVVKFYVFNGFAEGANPGGNPINAASLDGLGDRPLPQLCMVCHGGFIPNPSNTGGVPTAVFGSRDDVKLDAKFLPFDLSSFTFAAPDSDPTASSNKLNQQAAFHTLNRIAKVAPPPPSSPPPPDPAETVIEALYAAWYPGSAAPQRETAVVPLWDIDAEHRGVYTSVVARACRTCHVANPELTLRFEQPGTSAGVSFDGRLGQVQERVCREHVMPHARRTHDLFWTSVGPSQPAQLQIYGDTLNVFGWDIVGSSANVSADLLCGQEYTQGGPPIQTPFSPVARVFSDNGCTLCHSTASAAAGLNLDPAVAHASIVNIASTQDMNGMPLITPNDPTNSYLVRKIFGTHTTSPAAGFGQQMPANRVCTPNTSCLNSGDDTILLDWINTGALP